MAPVRPRAMVGDAVPHGCRWGHAPRSAHLQLLGADFRGVCLHASLSSRSSSKGSQACSGVT